MKQPFTAIILAGGKSTRMGKNKALLPFFERTNIENIVMQCQQVASEVIIVANDFDQYEFLHLPLVCDCYKGVGPMAGVEAGLQAAIYDKCMVIACDMPFIKAEMMKQLILELETYDAVVPSIEGKLQPLFAAYRKTCLAVIEEKIRLNQHKMMDLYKDINVKIMTEQEIFLTKKEKHDAFFNMNRPEDYEIAKEIEKMLLVNEKGLLG